MNAASPNPTETDAIDEIARLLVDAAEAALRTGK